MNTESDTPRTDEVEDGCINPVAWADFARQLERELNAAMAANRLTNEKKEQEKTIDT
jgi:hypothetical protein